MLAHRARRSLVVSSALVVLAASLVPAAGAVQPAEQGGALVVPFDADPLVQPATLVEGAAFERCTFVDTPPAFPGDTPGALRARYLATAADARVGWRLDAPLTQDDPFSAAAVFVLRSEGFVADPDGFAQISWGLWNTATTGFNRSAFGPDADSFELLEFDYFPNVSPSFGGPYVSPTLFGAADADNPSFPDAGAYANAAFFFGPPVALPLDEPLLVLLEHRPDDGVVVFTVQRITDGGALLPVPGAQAILDIGALSLPRYAFDAAGLTMYRDPFSGPSPSIDVQVDYHLLVVRRGLIATPDLPAALRALGGRP